MTTEFKTDVSSDESHTVAINIGKRLKAARTERNLDARQVATELKIPIDQVRALEEERFNYFRSVTFARGHLKSYGRLLELDVNEMLNACDLLSSDAESNIKPVDKVVNKQASFADPIIILISIVIIAILIFLACWWPTFSSKTSTVIQNNPPVDQTMTDDVSMDQSDTVPSPALATSPDQISGNASQEASTTQSTDSTRDTKMAETTPDNPQPNEEDSVTTGLAAETTTILKKSGVNPVKVAEGTSVLKVPDKEAVTTVQPPIYEHDIEVHFSADSWTEIRDGTGKILFSGIKPAGSTLALDVTEVSPYHIVFGYVQGVSSFKFKGEVYDFSAYTHKDLARFELK